MKSIVPLLIIVGLLAYGAYAVFSERRGTEPAPVSVPQTYTSDVYRMSFTYPNTYTLTERDAEGSAERAHHIITLMSTADLPAPENGEGPTAITIDIYQNDLDNTTLLSWLTATNDSNFKLGDGMYASTTIDGAEAVRYRWSGLYEGETTAFVHGDSIVAVSVTYLAPEDQIRADYAALLASLNLN